MSATNSPKNGQAHVRSKKTFLEFKFIPYDNLNRVRRGSAPSRIASLNEDDEIRGSDVSIEDHVLWTSEDFESAPDVDESLGYSEDETFACDDSDRFRHGSSLEANGSLNISETHAKANVLQESCTILPEPGRALMRTKHTFLEFKFVADDDSMQVRRLSTPACFGSLGAAEDILIAGTSVSGEQVLWTSEELVPDEHMSISEGPRKSARKARRDKARPCKGKRIRYKKFLSNFCEQVDEDPEGFNIDLVEWPQSLINNQKNKEQLLVQLQDYRTQALQELSIKGDTRYKVPLQLESLL